MNSSQQRKLLRLASAGSTLLLSDFFSRLRSLPSVSPSASLQGTERASGEGLQVVPDRYAVKGSKRGEVPSAQRYFEKVSGGGIDAAKAISVATSLRPPPLWIGALAKFSKAIRLDARRTAEWNRMHWDHALRRPDRRQIAAIRTVHRSGFVAHLSFSPSQKKTRSPPLSLSPLCWRVQRERVEGSLSPSPSLSLSLLVFTPCRRRTLPRVPPLGEGARPRGTPPATR